MKKQGIKYFILIIVILIIVLYHKLEIKPYITKICGISALIVTTGSMEPTIDTGDMIIVKQYPKYEIGEIITYQLDNQYLVTHRIVKKDGEAYITKGDSNNIEDESISKSQIEGKVIFHSKILGKMKQHYIEILGVFIMLLLIITKKGGIKLEDK